MSQSTNKPKQSCTSKSFCERIGYINSSSTLLWFKMWPRTVLNGPNIKIKTLLILLHPVCRLLLVVHCQENGSELYDVVNSGKSGVSVLALRNLWDRKHSTSDVPDKKTPTEPTNELILPPALPPKCENRKLKGAVSLDTVFLARVRWATAVKESFTKNFQRHLCFSYLALGGSSACGIADLHVWKKQSYLRWSRLSHLTSAPTGASRTPSRSSSCWGTNGDEATHLGCVFFLSFRYLLQYWIKAPPSASCWVNPHPLHQTKRRPRSIQKDPRAREEPQTLTKGILKILIQKGWSSLSRGRRTTRVDLQGDQTTTLMMSPAVLQLPHCLPWWRSAVTPTHSTTQSWAAPRQTPLRVERCSDPTRFTKPLRDLRWDQWSRIVSHILRFLRGQPAPEGSIIRMNRSQRSPTKETLTSQWRRWGPRRNLPPAKA